MYLYGGPVNSTASAPSFINCLFDRVQVISLTPYDANHTVYLQNNTFHGGCLSLETPNWAINDNIFDKTTLEISVLGPNYSASHNAYVNVSPYAPVPGDNSPIALSASPTYAVGQLGSFYLGGNNTALICPVRSPAKTAGAVGLYHYTVLANHPKEGSSSLSIGYHYVALNSGNGPIDTAFEAGIDTVLPVGAPPVGDYLKDYNGNGTFERGVDIANWNPDAAHPNHFRRVDAAYAAPYNSIDEAYYLRPDGPWAGPGDIILVENGVYTEIYRGTESPPSENLYLRGTGTPAAPITIAAANLGGAVIDPKNVFPLLYSGYAIFISGDYHIIQGFEIRNGPYTGIFVSSSHNQISNNEIHNNGNVLDSGNNNGQSGVFSATGMTDNAYTNNYVHHNGRSGDNAHLDHGLYLAGNNELAANNIIYANSGSGIQIGTCVGCSAGPTKVYNNTIVRNVTGSGISLYGGPLVGIDIQNNILEGNHHYGIRACQANGGPATRIRACSLITTCSMETVMGRLI